MEEEDRYGEWVSFGERLDSVVGLFEWRKMGNDSVCLAYFASV